MSQLAVVVGLTVDVSIWVWGIGGEALEARGRQRPGEAWRKAAGSNAGYGSC